MKKITFDTNCIIEIEENRPSAPFLKELIILNGKGLISLQVCAISASGRQKGGRSLTNFSEFEKRIAYIGLENVEIFLPIFYWGVCFWCKCIYPNEKMVTLEKKFTQSFFQILHMNIRKKRKKNGLMLNVTY